VLDVQAKADAAKAALDDLIDMLAGVNVDRARAGKEPPKQVDAKPTDDSSSELPPGEEDEDEAFCPTCGKPKSECTCED
jgi:hypothetical protein